MTSYPRDDSGQIQVDFVWGNFPLQPDEDRGGPGQSDTLDMSLDNHVIAEIGWSNYPAYIPNYAGDGDVFLEAVVPDVLRKTVAEAQTILNEANLNLQNTSHTLAASYITSTGKTVRVSAVSDSFDYGPALSGLRVGDELHFTLDIGSGPTTVDFGTVKVTKINEDGENSWFEFKVGTAPSVAYDDVAVGTIYGGENLINVITVQAAGGGGSAGTIHNENYNVWTRTFTYWD